MSILSLVAFAESDSTPELPITGDAEFRQSFSIDRACATDAAVASQGIETSCGSFPNQKSAHGAGSHLAVCPNAHRSPISA
jgi:hypothetical protein